MPDAGRVVIEFADGAEIEEPAQARFLADGMLSLVNFPPLGRHWNEADRERAASIISAVLHLDLERRMPLGQDEPRVEHGRANPVAFCRRRNVPHERSTERGFVTVAAPLGVGFGYDRAGCGRSDRVGGAGGVVVGGRSAVSWALGVGLWALGFGLWALGFGLWALGFKVSKINQRLMPNAQRPTPNAHRPTTMHSKQPPRNRLAKGCPKSAEVSAGPRRAEAEVHRGAESIARRRGA